MPTDEHTRILRLANRVELANRWEEAGEHKQQIRELTAAVRVLVAQNEADAITIESLREQLQ